MQNLDEVLKLPPAEFDAHWDTINRVIATLPDNDKRIDAWGKILSHLDDARVSKGMPFFRLGIYHLLRDRSEETALEYLEKAYKEDQRYGREQGKDPTRMGAYRLLALVSGFFEYLREEKDWKAQQLEPPHRETLVKTLLTVYDNTLVDVLDMGYHTYPVFQTLICDRNLCRFAIENYFCAINLLEMFSLAGQHIDKHRDEYPLARAIIGLLGGVLEAFLVDRLPKSRGGTLGRLLSQAHASGVVQVGTKLASLSSLIHYFRNYIHADRDATREAYFIDINVAKGVRVALDWLLNELLSGRVGPTRGTRKLSP